MSTLDEHYLRGVSFTLDGETVPASELRWSMIAPCGCISGLHMMTEDTITEAMAWKAMGGSAAEMKRDKARGFTLKMAKVDVIKRFQDCPHDPRWGYVKPARPEGYSWASYERSRLLHLVQLTESDGEYEWAEDGREVWRTQVASLCGKTEIVRVWSRKWFRTDGKVECTRCDKLGHALIASGSAVSS